MASFGISSQNKKKFNNLGNVRKKKIKKKIFFFDRDGILIKAKIVNNKPYSFNTIKKITFSKGIKSVLSLTKKMGYINVMITNQPDIAQKKIEHTQVIKINSYIKTVSEERIKEIQASETAILNTADICYSLSYETLKQTKIIKNRKKIVINPFSLISTDINTRWNNEKPRLRYRGKIVLGFAGRPEGTKGLDFLLKYVQKFHHKGIHYSLALSTSVRPSEYLYVNNFLILDCEECTLVWNLNQTEMNTFYKSIDYLVAPSRYDAFNLTVLESFSRKIKVLASDTTGAVYSIILNGKRISDIYIYKHNNFKSFCRELTRMIKNKKNYKIWHISIFYKFFKLKSIREVQIEALYE
jgi:glycosyltransferase involved in cell wall biosynthesis